MFHQVAAQAAGPDRHLEHVIGRLVPLVLAQQHSVGRVTVQARCQASRPTPARSYQYGTARVSLARCPPLVKDRLDGGGGEGGQVGGRHRLGGLHDGIPQAGQGLLGRGHLLLSQRQYGDNEHADAAQQVPSPGPAHG